MTCCTLDGRLNAERRPERWGKPEDLGGMAVFLASRASSHVHGAVYNVDGGWMAR
jgi:NAD(P)-dependent dehydrogenase (short-subunit alcohol dehydrogenase family)